MALQRYGDVDMDGLITAMQAWSSGSALEQRAAAAALCEPRLLTQADHARAVLQFSTRLQPVSFIVVTAAAMILSPCEKGSHTAGVSQWLPSLRQVNR